MLKWLNCDFVGRSKIVLIKVVKFLSFLAIKELRLHFRFILRTWKFSYCQLFSFFQSQESRFKAHNPQVLVYTLIWGLLLASHLAPNYCLQLKSFLILILTFHVHLCYGTSIFSLESIRSITWNLVWLALSSKYCLQIVFVVSISFALSKNTNKVLALF
jgi:hypothetical protein